MARPPARIMHALILASALGVNPGWAAGDAPVPANSPAFHVAPTGNDSWPGSADKPFASLHAARDAARKLPAEQPRRVVLQGGEYFLDQPLVLGAQDSGLAIEAAPGAKATLYGGRKVTGWERDGEQFWAARLPEVAAGKWDFRMLAVNGRFARRARLPKSGDFEHLSRFDVPWMSTTGGGWQRKPTHAELTTLKFRPADLGPWLDLRNAELTVYHMWDESVVGLAAMDETAQTLTFSTEAGHPPGAFGVRRYAVWNVRQGMTEPGQWYLDRTAGKAVYWPLPGEDMAKAEVLAPTMESILRLEGTKEVPIRDVAVRGLTLSVATTPLRAGGFGAGNFNGAIQLLHTENCRLERLTLVNVGGHGIKESAGRGLRIEHCEVHHTGACGIKLDGAGHVVADCRIHDVGVTYPSAIALWGGGKANLYSHNEVRDTPYTAIAAGGEDHVIEANLIHHAMKQLHDGAGIYITFCKHITLRGNFIRDITDTGGYGASAYYLDEQAEGCLVEGNLALRVARPSHNHMAKGNTVRNNVFLSDADAILTFPRSSDYRFEKNVIVAKGKIAFQNPAAIKVFQDNVLFSGTGQVEGQTLRDYSPAGAEPLKPGGAGVRADPRLTVSEKGAVAFAPDSPALKLGIVPIDVSAAGPR